MIELTKYLLKLIAIVTFSLCVNRPCSAQKPNIIYIYVDDMGYGELGSYGQTKIKTPHLDQLAREGIRFTQHYSGAPVCAPARAMLMTGKHSGHAYIRGNYELGGFEDDMEGGQMPLPEGTFTIGHLMQQAGYATAAIGKWGLGMHNTTGNPNKQGFDYFYGYLDQKQAHNFYPTHLWENSNWDSLDNSYVYVHQRLPEDAPDSAFNRFQGNEYSIDKMTEKAIDFIQNHKDSPFFLYLPFTGPHVSLQVPQEEIKKYLGQFDEQPYYGEQGYAANKYPLSTYAAMISYCDAQIGKLLELLKSLDLDEHTLVMFSSDNGPTFNGGVDIDFFNSTGGLRGRKQDLYEGGIRVPFIARWPGKISPGRITHLISTQYDLMETLADITGEEPWENDGISFLPTLLGNDREQKTHPHLYFEFPEQQGQIAIRIQNLKAVKSNIRGNKNAPWEIYDLETDPGETKNIVDRYPQLIEQLEEIVTNEHTNSHIKEWEFINSKL